MRFRRKSDSDPGEQDGATDGTAESEALEADVDPETRRAASGPLDSEELGEDEIERVDLGSLLIVPDDGRELRLQVDEASGQVQAVHLAGPDGLLDLRAFAASRNADLWGEVRPQIAAELAQGGGFTDEREGPFGPELIAQVPTGQPNQVQVTRIIGVNGPRWLLRATLYGRPAMEPDTAGDWEDSIRRVIVHRGAHAVPPGEALPVVMPAQARRLEP